MIKSEIEPDFLVVDLFCGAGGVTTGFTLANNGKTAVVIACVNHDPIAIKSHWENHKEVEHFEEDITKLYGYVFEKTLFITPKMLRLVRLVNIYRAFYPNAKVILWASLECTNFSKAKGGMSRDADSRTLAEHLDRYIHAIDPDCVQIENVVEFMSWGPLTSKVVKSPDGYGYCCPVQFIEIQDEVIDKNGFPKKDKSGKRIYKPSGNFKTVYSLVPESKDNGKDYLRWKQHICDIGGYRDEWKELNSANYGAFTSRNRLFGIFAKAGFPIVWPSATHSKKPSKDNLFGDLKKWMPVKDCLDFSDVGQSIFNRKTPLVPKTLERIYAGLVKFVANGDDSFVMKYFSGNPEHKVVSMDFPCPTIKTKDGNSIVFISKYNSTNHKTGKLFPGSSIDEPCHTISCQNRLAKTTVDFLVKFNNNEDAKSLDNPSPTLTTKDKLGLVLMKYHGNGHNLLSPDEPASTLTTKDRIATVFIDQQYGQSRPSSIENPAGSLTANPKLALAYIDRNFTSRGGKHVDINGPIGAIMTVPKANLVHIETKNQYLMSTQFNNIGSELNEPSPVITANRKHHYLVNPQFASKGGDVNDPCFTLIARMDKMPPYLLEAESGETTIIIYPEDILIMQKIKVFMAVFGIVDIKMRMLKVPELLKIQGFPHNYILKGSQADQKKFIGNSVVPHVVKSWIEALSASVRKQIIKQAA